MNDLLDFLKRSDGAARTGADRAAAMLWWLGREGNTPGLTTAEICELIEGTGHPRQNSSRLDAQLGRDRRFGRVPGTKAWRLHPRAPIDLESKLASFLDKPAALPASDSVLPRALFAGTRGYIERVVQQINASYDAGLYDCCAVMCRRLLETLIIEVYEHVGRADAIKANDQNFFMLAELLRILSSDKAFNLGRNAKKGLEDFKRLGDQSAHNRRFNAQKNDLDRIRDGVRIAAEELLHLASLAKTQ